MSKYAIGVDIGATGTKIGLADENGNITAKAKFKTYAFETADNYVQFLSSEIYKLILQAPESKISGIGIGAPNANYYTGCIEEAPNLPWKGTIRLVEKLRQNFHTNVVMTNDANAAALGEKIYGKAKGLSEFLIVTLGTGVGSGFVTKGEIIYGSTGFAGELGHTIVVRNGRQCNCGRKGCLETYCSATGMVRTMREWLNEGKKSVLATKQDFNSEDIYNAAINGDETAAAVFDYTGDLLGFQLAQAVAITSPSRIFLFGGPAAAGNLILQPTVDSFNRNILNIFKHTVKIEISGLNDDSNAAILGAAALVM